MKPNKVGISLQNVYAYVLFWVPTYSSLVKSRQGHLPSSPKAAKQRPVPMSQTFG